MPVTTKTKYINTIYLGKEVCVQIEEVKNTGSIPAQGTYVQLTIPEGVAFERANLPVGTYDTTTNRWNIGTLLPGQQYTGEVCFEVTDECLSSFKFEFQVGSTSSCESCTVLSIQCLILQGQSCCEIDNCGFSKFGSLTYDEICPDPLPTEPTSPPENPIDEQYHIEFYQNCEIWFQYDAENEVWNVVNGVVVSAGTISEVGNTIAGHRIATHYNHIDPIVDINETITTIGDVVDGHLIATHNSEDGTITEIDETITTVTNVVAGHLIATYTDENGDATEIDETITELVEEIEGPLTYTDETGTPTTVGHQITAGVVNVNYNISNQFTVNFPFTFTNPPIVNITPANPSSGTYYVKIVSVSTTQFVATASYITPMAGLYSSYHWIAVSQSGATISPTPSPTPFITPTGTPTPTPTKTPTITPSVTNTPIASPTTTPTPTPDVTPSNTPTTTPTITPSNTVGVTPTMTPTSSVTPSITPSTGTATPTPTPTITPTVTLSVGVEPTPTPTSTTTPGLTPSNTPVASPTPSVTASITPTPSTTTGLEITPSNTPSNTPTNTPTTSEGAVPTATPTPTKTPTPSPSPA